jgi:hypothetical protein
LLNFFLWFGFILRLIVAIWNGFYGPSFGADADAIGFHYNGVELSNANTLEIFENLERHNLYSSFLGLIYSLTSNSLFIGSFLSVIAWVFSAALLIRIMRMLSIRKSSQWKAMLIYALLPSSIMLTSITLREAYQLLAVNCAVYFSLKVYVQRLSFYWVYLMIAIAIMGVLHKALFVTGLFILVSVLFLLTLNKHRRFSFGRLIVVMPIILLSTYYGVILFSSTSYNLNSGLVGAVQRYQEGLIASGGGSIYRSSIEIDGMGSFIFQLPIFLFQYLFEPMPWTITRGIDGVSFIENLLRLWLIFKALQSCFFKTQDNMLLVKYVLIIYLVIEIIWSLGVSTWGSAMRHHIPSMGLLLIAAFSHKARLIK